MFVLLTPSPPCIARTCFILQNWNPVPMKPPPSPQPPATTILLSFSMRLTPLGASQKYNHSVCLFMTGLFHGVRGKPGMLPMGQQRDTEFGNWKTTTVTCVHPCYGAVSEFSFCHWIIFHCMDLAKYLFIHSSTMDTPAVLTFGCCNNAVNVGVCNYLFTPLLSVLGIYTQK